MDSPLVSDGLAAITVKVNRYLLAAWPLSFLHWRAFPSVQEMNDVKTMPGAFARDIDLRGPSFELPPPDFLGSRRAAPITRARTNLVIRILRVTAVFWGPCRLASCG
jgi:hypothetical protein